mmetsp:Transcript_72421/g.170331  ORF Transcript_72421/g.170331 Transcript_72421/m.170331 type:complete len:194 (+) Transcript_72421:3-584(+)
MTYRQFGTSLENLPRREKNAQALRKEEWPEDVVEEARRIFDEACHRFIPCTRSGVPEAVQRSSRDSSWVSRDINSTALGGISREDALHQIHTKACDEYSEFLEGRCHTLEDTVLQLQEQVQAQKLAGQNMVREFVRARRAERKKERRDRKELLARIKALERRLEDGPGHTPRDEEDLTGSMRLFREALLGHYL